MIRNTTKDKVTSGYLRLSNDLVIKEIAGNFKTLFNENLIEDGNLFDFIADEDKALLSPLLNGLNIAIDTQSVYSCTISKNNREFRINITPLLSNDLILSFSEETKRVKTNQAISALNSDLVISLQLDTDLHHLNVTNNINKIGNFKVLDLIGRHINKVGYPAGFADKLKELINKVAQSKEEIHSEIKFSIGSHSFYYKTIISEELLQNKSAIYNCYLTDISDFKNKESELEDRIKRLQYVIEASDTGVWDWFVGKSHIYYSRKWKSQLGYYHDEITNQFDELKKLLHHDDRDRVLHELNSFIKGDSLVFETEYRLRHKKGNYIWIKNRAICKRNSENKAIRMLGTHTDISNEKRLETELNIFKQTALNSQSSIIITDTEGFIEFFNPAFGKISGWDAGQIIGKKPTILNSGFHSRDFYVRLWKNITHGNIWQGEIKNKKKNGRYYWEYATIAPIKNSNGITTHFVKISEDISLLKKIETDLRNARRSAEVANIYKNNFLSNMSHKIRTPINGIIGFSDLLRTASPDEKQQQLYLSYIEQNSNALLRLIDNVIDVARIEANEMKIKKESCSLKDIFIEMKIKATELAKNNGKSNLNVNFVIPKEEHHDVIFTDPVRLKQVIQILFENALKQTEIGFIEVGYQVYSERKLQFYIQDTGIGIPEKQLSILNHQFKSKEKQYGQTKGGIGLGLSISKGLIRLLGGQLGVKSNKKGSIFYFSMPYDKIKIQPKKSIIEKSKRSKYDFSKYTILIAEDVIYNFEYLKNVFASTGVKILWAKDGIDVLNIFNNNKIDLILMDIQLPEISGFEATRQIRKKNKDVPIIAQTGFTMDEDRQKCFASGCNDVLIKPLKIEEVLKVVSKFLKS